MKKRFMSLLLAVIMAFGVVSPSFAAGTSGDGSEIEPFNNRYYYVTEYSSPDYEVDSVRNVTYEDYKAALLGEAVSAGLLGVIAAALPSQIDDSVIAPYVARVAIALYDCYVVVKNQLMDDDIFYTVTVSSQHEYRYQVDRLDESNRHCVSEKIHFKVVTEYIDGSTDELTKTVTMK